MKVELTHEITQRMIEKLGCRKSLEAMVCLLELPDGLIREEDETNDLNQREQNNKGALNE